jgi:uncharacterized membrane protein
MGLMATRNLAFSHHVLEKIEDILHRMSLIDKFYIEISKISWYLAKNDHIRF